MDERIKKLSNLVSSVSMVYTNDLNLEIDDKIFRGLLNDKIKKLIFTDNYFLDLSQSAIQAAKEEIGRKGKDQINSELKNAIYEYIDSFCKTDYVCKRYLESRKVVSNYIRGVDEIVKCKPDGTISDNWNCVDVIIRIKEFHIRNPKLPDMIKRDKNELIDYINLSIMSDSDIREKFNNLKMTSLILSSNRHILRVKYGFKEDIIN